MKSAGSEDEDGGGATTFQTLDELEGLAATRVSESIWAYIQGGAGDERTIEWNRAAFRRWALRPRALVDVSSIDLSGRVLGGPVSAPFYVAPTAYNGEVHPDGELGVARAASRAGILAAFSTLSTAPLEAIAATEPSGPRWFQLYLQSDPGVSHALVRRAEDAGFSAVVVTVDVPVLGTRGRQARGGFAIDSSRPIGNGPGVRAPARAPEWNALGYRLPPEAATSWEIFHDLSRSTKLPLVAKGVLTPEDARRAIEAGARAVIVSNHGGRQLDGAPATLDVLPEIVAEVGDRAEVYLDGGVRRAADILIALSLGARAVGLGRPILWALAAGGRQGVTRYLSVLAEELATSMALCGRRSLAEIDRSLCVRRSG